MTQHQDVSDVDAQRAYAAAGAAAGQRAYELYRQSITADNGAPWMTSWEDLPEEVQAGWIVVGSELRPAQAPPVEAKQPKPGTVALRVGGLVGGSLFQLFTPSGQPVLVDRKTGGNAPTADVIVGHLRVPPFPADADTVDATFIQPTTVNLTMDPVDDVGLQDDIRRQVAAQARRRFGTI